MGSQVWSSVWISPHDFPDFVGSDLVLSDFILIDEQFFGANIGNKTSQYGSNTHINHHIDGELQILDSIDLVGSANIVQGSGSHCTCREDHSKWDHLGPLLLRVGHEITVWVLLNFKAHLLVLILEWSHRAMRRHYVYFLIFYYIIIK